MISISRLLRPKVQPGVNRSPDRWAIQKLGADDGGISRGRNSCRKLRCSLRWNLRCNFPGHRLLKRRACSRCFGVQQDAGTLWPGDGQSFSTRSAGASEARSDPLLRRTQIGDVARACDGVAKFWRHASVRGAAGPDPRSSLSAREDSGGDVRPEGLLRLLSWPPRTQTVITGLVPVIHVLLS